MKVSIILPTYNERGNIVPLIQSILDVCRKNNIRQYEIIVVDDNSPDKTATLCRNHFKENKSVFVYVRKNHKGLASAIFYGVTKSSADTVIVMDTDFNHDPAKIPDMFKKVNSKTIVVGSRFVDGGGMEDKSRYYLSKAYNYCLKRLFRVSFSDFLSGYFCAKKSSVLFQDQLFQGYGDYFIRFLVNAHREGFIIKDIPVFYINRRWGGSKSQLITMLAQYSRTVFKCLTKGPLY